MMKLVGMRAPAGLLPRFIVCLRKDDPDSIKSLEYVLEYLCKSTDDIGSFLDEYYKTFRRKKLVWLFTSATTAIFILLESMSLKIRFFAKVVQVMQYLQQQ